MAIDLKLKLSQTQQLIMTPQLQQAIKLLQLSRMELQDVVSQELLENPVLEDQIEALRQNIIQALVVQDPYRMGYGGVRAAYDACKGKDVEKYIDTGVTIVTKENLDTPEIQKFLNP